MAYNPDRPKGTGQHDMFQASDVRPCRQGAKELADAVIAMFAAQAALEVKKQQEPDYMPTTTSADWCAEEQDDWNRAAERLQLAVFASERT